MPPHRRRGARPARARLGPRPAARRTTATPRPPVSTRASSRHRPIDARGASRSRSSPGIREFWGRDFAVTPRRPGPAARNRAHRRGSAADPARPRTPRSSTSAPAAAAWRSRSPHERPQARVVATDISHEALLVAAANAARHGVDGRVQFVRTRPARAALRIQADLDRLEPAVRARRGDAGSLRPTSRDYEPATALFGGRDGLAVIDACCSTRAPRLAPGGRLHC